LNPETKRAPPAYKTRGRERRTKSIKGKKSKEKKSGGWCKTYCRATQRSKAEGKIVLNKKKKGMKEIKSNLGDVF